ncbi:hypothetical protein M378DRAFT_171332 [Amanita muscaria Koide BX008]|uniref:NACHT domain-containing protein n=1 Tax=Amanita muscaria (strain Koide BX008) TaxID=946122 RepID=A0A0C2SUQ7_AMAMK|nr:hypothetical protein M378DRAFT_171332 [Amanita muscaria Koide BX008]
MSTATQDNANSISSEEIADNRSHLMNAGNPDSDMPFLKEFTSFVALHDSSAQDPDRICIPGTRQHVIEAIQRWFDDPSAERIFWLHGPVGAGKSAIAQTVARPYGRDKVAATFFFFRSDPSHNDGNRLFTTLAWQLAISIPTIKDHISHMLNKRPDLPTKNVETQFEELIVQPLLALNRTSAMPKNSVIIIDGIDECRDERLQQRILKVIGTAVKNPNFPLRFLISSRPEAHIEETINRFEPPILRIDLASRLHDANRDVEHYLRSEFARIAAERGLDPMIWPGQDIVQRLVFMSAGQFLYATDVIRLVGDADNDALTQLDIIFGPKPPHTTSPFARLDQAYLEILQRQPDQDFLKTFLVLLVDCCSTSRDNPRDDDAMLMGISRVDLGRKLRRMRSILKFEPYIDVHYPSFVEFLQDPSRSGQYHVSTSAGTRRKLESMTKLLIGHAARLIKQPDFHGSDHFAPEFGKQINRNLQAIELDIEDREQILRPLLDVLDKLLLPSNIGFLKDGYCQQCRFFQTTYDILTHLKSLREREDPDVEKCLKSLEEIIQYGDGGQQDFDMNFGRVFSSAAIVGFLMAILAHQR